MADSAKAAARVGRPSANAASAALANNWAGAFASAPPALGIDRSSSSSASSRWASASPGESMASATAAASIAAARACAGSWARRWWRARDPGRFDSASASFQSPAGKISVDWKQRQGTFVLNVSVPQGIDAEAILPGGTRRTLTAGAQTLTVPLR